MKVQLPYHTAVNVVKSAFVNLNEHKHDPMQDETSQILWDHLETLGTLGDMLESLSGDGHLITVTLEHSDLQAISW